jgi:hypothetical protein
MQPDQSRLTLPNPTPTSFDDVSANNTRLTHWSDRLPVFEPRFVIDSASVTIPISTTENLTDPITFLKDESWTDVIITAMLPGVYNSNGAAGVFTVDYVVDDNTPVYLTRHDWNIAAVQRHLVAGMARIDGLRAGTHTIQLQGSANATVVVMVDLPRTTHLVEVLPPTY